MKPFIIISFCILSAVMYGIIHDQLTVRICLEYFTIGHPRIFPTESPSLIALGWGIVATWWVGLILGVILSLAARYGPWPKLPVRSLIRPIIILPFITGVVSILAGWVGRSLAENGYIYLFNPMASRVPLDKHTAFLTDLWAHSAAYITGFIGGIVIAIYVLIKRAREARDLFQLKSLLQYLLIPRLSYSLRNHWIKYLVILLIWSARILGLAIFLLLAAIFIGEGGLRFFNWGYDSLRAVFSDDNYPFRLFNRLAQGRDRRSHDNRRYYSLFF